MLKNFVRVGRHFQFYAKKTFSEACLNFFTSISYTIFSVCKTKLNKSCEILFIIFIQRLIVKNIFTIVEKDGYTKLYKSWIKTSRIKFTLNVCNFKCTYWCLLYCWIDAAWDNELFVSTRIACTNSKIQTTYYACIWNWNPIEQHFYALYYVI